jgi:TatD DNase family protein
VNICTDPESLIRSLTLRSQFPWIYNVAATHPHDVEKEGEAHFPFFAQHAREGNLVAIGETGLDYHYQHSTPEIQKQFLRRYLKLALECRLPVVIHCREAFADLFPILDEVYRGAPFVLHCFTGTLEEAQQVIERGGYLSLSGVVTYKKSEQLREVAKSVPLDRLLIETDAPYLAPQSRRGKPNEPAFLPETASCIASLRSLSLEELALATSGNAQAFFNLTKL